MLRRVFFVIILLVGAALGWIRLAPSDLARWHVDPMVTTDQDLVTGVRRKFDGDLAMFNRLHAIVLATPRTELLAGGPSEGLVTYVTRTQWWGFPDYTTVALDNGVIELWARLRFGTSDMGVNHDRVEAWLATLQQSDKAG